MKKKQLGYFIQIIVVVVLVAIGIWRQHTRVYSASQSDFLMDTLFEIEIESRYRNLEALLDSAFVLAKFYEQKLSCYDPSSLVTEINQSSGSKTPIDEDIYKLLNTGKYFHDRTGGRYDLSVGLLTEIWDVREAEIPSEKEIDAALDLTGFDRIVFERDHILMPEGMKLNFGSIAKGYVIDILAEYLTTRGVTSYLINAGGDLKIKSPEKIMIGIQHPRQDHGEIIDIISVSNMAVVTSGDYERYFELDGRRYHHLLNAVSGYPAEECISVTVIAETAKTADALSTAVFLLPVDEGIKLVESLDNAWAIIYHLNEQREIEKRISMGTEKYLE